MMKELIQSEKCFRSKDPQSPAAWLIPPASRERRHGTSELLLERFHVRTVLGGAIVAVGRRMWVVVVMLLLLELTVAAGAQF